MAVGSSGTTAVRRGRRPGASSTRGTVLEAARAQFARDGFAATTIRGVAEAAGVDASLVMQFFGSKQELFAAVLSVPARVMQRLDVAFDGPQEHLGERVVRAFFDVWEGAPADTEPLMVMLRSAVVNDVAREQLRGFIEARLLDGVRRRTHYGAEDDSPGDGDGDTASETAGDADAALRAGIAASMLVGVVLGRRIIEVPTLVSAEREELVRIVAPAVHAVLVPAAPPAAD